MPPVICHTPSPWHWASKSHGPTVFVESLLMGDHPGKTTLSLKVIFFPEAQTWELVSALHIHRFCFLRFNQLQIEFCRLTESADMEPWMCRADWTTNKKPVDLGTHGLRETTPMNDCTIIKVKAVIIHSFTLKSMAIPGRGCYLKYVLHYFFQIYYI